jgi:hypothetical protein
MALSKAFSVWEQVAVKFRFDAFNTFNHINSSNPSNTDIFSQGPITGSSTGPGVINPRYLELSLRVQF